VLCLETFLPLKPDVTPVLRVETRKIARSLGPLRRLPHPIRRMSRNNLIHNIIASYSTSNRICISSACGSSSVSYIRLFLTVSDCKIPPHSSAAKSVSPLSTKLILGTSWPGETTNHLARSKICQCFFFQKSILISSSPLAI
jgi:hypothetical protein